MRRYASASTIPASAIYAWQLLGTSVYQVNPFGAHSLMLHRPALDRGQSVRNFVSFIYISEKILS
jgi:hypothetical protein